MLMLTDAFRPKEAVCEYIWWGSSLAGTLWAVKGIGNIQLHTSLHTVCIEPWWAWSRWGVTGISSKLSGPCIFTSTASQCGCVAEALVCANSMGFGNTNVIWMRPETSAASVLLVFGEFKYETPVWKCPHLFVMRMNHTEILWIP